MRTTSPSSACGPTRTDSRSANGPRLTACSTGPGDPAHDGAGSSPARLEMRGAAAAPRSRRGRRASPSSVPSMTLPSHTIFSPAAMRGVGLEARRHARLGGQTLGQRARVPPSGQSGACTMRHGRRAAGAAAPPPAPRAPRPARVSALLPQRAAARPATAAMPGAAAPRSALLFVQAAMGRQARLRRSDALAPPLPLLLERLAHARARAGLCLRCAVAAARLVRLAEDLRRTARARSVSISSSSARFGCSTRACLDRQPSCLEPQLARAGARRDRASARRPGASGTISDQRRERRQRCAQQPRRRCRLRRPRDTSTSGACAQAPASAAASSPAPGRAHERARRAGSRRR